MIFRLMKKVLKQRRGDGVFSIMGVTYDDEVRNKSYSLVQQ